MNSAYVSIGMPVYNGENYIKEALDSILAQSFRNFELIISDNASTDTTEKICRSYAEKDQRIKYYRTNQNRGAAWNFQQVFHLAKGQYFQWACHDDVWAPTLMERCVEVLGRCPDVVLCYTKAAYIDANGTRIERSIARPGYHDKEPHQRFRSLLQYHIRPNECSQVLGLFRTSVLKKSSLIRSYPASDMVLLGEIALYGEFHEIPESLFLRRDHPGTSVRANPTNEERAVWFNPSQMGKLQMPTWRWFFEWGKSICRSPIGAAEGLKCSRELTRWAWLNRGIMRRELVHGFKKWSPVKTG
jgi:glycosyltransferase involved in cell wall biosynthesis